MWNYVDRGHKDTLVLIPGWATDYRIFDLLDIKFNYLMPLKFSPFGFNDQLLDKLRQDNINKISIFGWSMGGFVASAFASLYPEIIDKLILVGIRKKHNPDELLTVKTLLNKGKAAYLYRFYTHCFSNKKQISWFKKELFNYYCREMNMDYLLSTLDYLAKTEITAESLKRVKNIRIIHGEYDNIAPIKEAIEIKDELPQAEFIKIEKAGHTPFLKVGFKDCI